MIIGIKTFNKNINGKISPPNGQSSVKKRISTTSKIFFLKIKYLFIFRQHYKYEDITPARREFLEKQDENMTQKRQEADLSYWAQVNTFTFDH